MEIKQPTAGDLISFKSVLGTKQPNDFPPYIGKMAYYAIKFNGGHYDRFEKVVGK